MDDGVLVTDNSIIRNLSPKNLRAFFSLRTAGYTTLWFCFLMPPNTGFSGITESIPFNQPFSAYFKHAAGIVADIAPWRRPAAAFAGALLFGVHPAMLNPCLGSGKKGHAFFAVLSFISDCIYWLSRPE